MQFKSIMLAFTLALSITACSSVQKVVYRIDVPQGNYLEASKVKKVSAGMTSEQVQYLLGTPVLIDPFNQYVWHYVFLQQKAYENPEQHTFTVKFDHRGIVTEANLDSPLPDEEKVEVNNTIIDSSNKAKKAWWHFWN
ncbi:Beta-barrel assembly machine subunit BamE [Bisgaardia hudsonensis]|uniref:Outer membrane protein assembly factor BamE n=1 Tax=Bisgaardia hudsonensis TaxID=109472 RepID=A0A4V2SJ12_9PAST|nr:outer membrane protein assembly factor BamE [Bisgaardia hudsonensis]QLB12331.1 cell envelope protein SmpA [Bisgaardia hudsonensis]TCP12378.1 Beta-barrel assembly machine subunit BamE [Bisgaardia hudsonensis]